MPAQRSLDARLAVTALLLGLAGACSPGPASFPDRDAVAAAQAEWCDALAKLQAPGGKWEHLAACKAAYPTSSPGYLRGMTKCFSRRVEAAGDQAPDNQQIITECNDEVTVDLKEDERQAQDVVEARCNRMERCEKIPIPECKAAFAKLEAAQRANFTIIYNAGGRYEIADCLDTASCTDDEESGRQACYAPVADKLLWFPE